MAERSDDPRLLSLVGPYEWSQRDRVHVIGGRHEGAVGTIVNVGDTMLMIRHDIGGDLHCSGRRFCEPTDHLIRHREAISLASYVETVASLLVTSSEYPNEWAEIWCALVAIIRWEWDDTLQDPELIGLSGASMLGLGQPGVMTGAARALLLVMPTEVESSLRFQQPGPLGHILYRRGGAPVPRGSPNR